jgi:hypothetical protein
MASHQSENSRSEVLHPIRRDNLRTSERCDRRNCSAILAVVTSERPVSFLYLLFRASGLLSPPSLPSVRSPFSTFSSERPISLSLPSFPSVRSPFLTFFSERPVSLSLRGPPPHPQGQSKDLGALRPAKLQRNFAGRNLRASDLPFPTFFSERPISFLYLLFLASGLPFSPRSSTPSAGTI